MNTITRGYPLRIAVGMAALVLLLAGGAGAQEYTYYLPHVLSTTEFYPANDAATDLQILTIENGTNYEIDQDGDGIYELQLTNLNAGNQTSYHRDNHGQGKLNIGASIRSNKPIQPVLEMWENDYGTYDHTNFQESLIPISEWGSEFVVPTDITYIYVFARETTQVTVTKP